MSTSDDPVMLSAPQPELRIEVRRYDDPVVTELVAQLQQIFVQRYGSPDQAVVDPAEFSPPNGLFLVGFVGEDAVASGGWRRLDEQTAEIKRMYVAERMQRRGLSRLMLAALEQAAGAAGVSELVLNTGVEQPEAIALYLSSGYREIPGFGYYANHAGAHFYGKTID
ncbi:Acetyltransferase (GNAT) family protein [Frankineae bacterium MT45]|nr:Acetyltransferase (GNAT) family protein [Frankineae bacterium MT45]